MEQNINGWEISTVAILDAKSAPWDVAISPDGTIYFTEEGTNRVRMIRDEQVTTMAGSGVWGYADGAALQAQFNGPRGLAISPDGGAIYVADHLNRRIRMIRDGQVTTVAGSGEQGHADGAALQAQFNGPTGLAISPDGGAIYVADQNSHRIRMIRDGQVTTVAGRGKCGYANGAALQAQFNYPTGLAISPNGGVIYVSDYRNKRIRMIRDGKVTTVAGNGKFDHADGAALQAQFKYPRGLAISPNGGAIYVVDCHNHRIRMIRDGKVTTVAGNGKFGHADGAALQAQFNYPTGLAISPDGDAVYVADSSNHRIRKIGLPLHSSAVDLRQAIDAQPNLDIKIGDVSLGFHKYLIAHRCPQLKQVLESTGSALAIEARAARALQSYVYTDTLPDREKLSSVEWLCLMLLLDRCGFADAAQQCHQQLRSLVVGVDACTIKDVLAMYTRSLDLRYDAGTQLALYLLRKHKSDVPVKQLPILMKDHNEYILDLLAELLARDAPLIFKPQPEKCMSLADTLIRLYETREGADFNIVIKGHNDNTSNSPPLRCHAFVLFARWPYFKAMFDAGMRETQRAKLELPGVGEDGGMHPYALQAILDVIYLDTIQPSTIKLFNPAVALQLLSVQGLYLSSFDTEEQKRENGGGGREEAVASAFSSLIRRATQLIDTGLNVDNCVEVYKTALEMQVEKVAELSEVFIVANITRLMVDSKHSAAILSLPYDIQHPLLRKCFASM